MIKVLYMILVCLIRILKNVSLLVLVMSTTWTKLLEPKGFGRTDQKIMAVIVYA